MLKEAKDREEADEGQSKDQVGRKNDAATVEPNSFFTKMRSVLEDTEKLKRRGATGLWTQRLGVTSTAQ